MNKQINAMLQTLYRTHGEPATYADSDGASSAVSVFVERNLTQYGDVAEIKAGSAIVAVRAAEVPQRPRREDTFTLQSGEVLYVDNVMLSDGFEHRCMTHER